MNTLFLVHLHNVIMQTVAYYVVRAGIYMYLGSHSNITPDSAL